MGGVPRDPAAALLDLAEVEHHAGRLRTAVTMRIQGLLQTTDHARELLRHVVPELSHRRSSTRVSFRVKRQTSLLVADAPTALVAVIHEAALRMRFGGLTVATSQLRHLLDMSERDHITLGVLPLPLDRMESVSLTPSPRETSSTS